MISAMSETQLSEVKAKYFNRCGNIIEIADFQIPGFKTWLDSEGNEISVGEKIKLISDLNLYMSCEWDYELTYNPNGGTGAKYVEKSTRHAYFDSSKQIKSKDAKITLKDYGYTNGDILEFNGYNISSKNYKIGDIVSLYKN